MTENTRKIVERMQASFPHLYNVYDKSTILYALLLVFGERYGMRTDIIDRLYAMIGIDSTYDEDLEHRWGSLLGMYRQDNESYDNYRSRLLIAYSSLSGGTAESIKYAIASTVGITDNNDINTYIHVYDAWEYPYEIDGDLLGIEIVDETSLYGSSICTVDVSNILNVNYLEITNAIDQVKASGINVYLLFLYGIINESVTLSRNDTNHDLIRYQTDDKAEFYEVMSGSAIFGKAIFGMAVLGNSITDETTDYIETDALVDNMTEVLNESFVTNMCSEPDEHTDIIIYH